ncbi:MAG: AAA family ATPase [Desulfobulbaceae bacterium]|jgi:pilus assembly protein CpaE|nr:AAA family ATPase [Desulfobulbaceae bacterium]
MPQTMQISIEISDHEMANSIIKDLESMVDVKVHMWYGEMGDKGTLAIKSSPDIIIIDDDLETGEIFRRLPKMGHIFPQTAIFVISNDKQPKHIVEVMKAGATEYLVLPLNPSVLTNAVEEVRAKLTETGRMAKGTVYSFISSKGGLGSTILSVNTAVTLAQTNDDGNAVALCDISFQAGDASVFLDIMPKTTIADICRNFHRLDVSLLKGAMIKHTSKLELLAAPLNPEDHEMIKAEHAEKIIGLLTKLYDRVIIDCPSMSVNGFTLEAFRASHKVFVVIDLSLPAIRNAVRLTQLISKHGINKEKIEFILNRYEKGSTLSIEEAEKSLGKRIYWLVPNDFSDIMSSINEGEPVVQLNPRSLIAQNILSLTQKLKGKLSDKEYRGAKTAFGRSI